MRGVNFNPRKCNLCGEIFTPTKNGQKYCMKMRIKKCAVCGKEMELACGSPFKETNCCSKECSHEYIYIQRDAKELAVTKICEVCGKEFHSRSNRTKICPGPHFRNCVVCGKKFELKVYDGSLSETLTCSKNCKYIYAAQQHDFAKGAETTKRNLIAKYGVDSVIKIPGVMDKMKATCREKYGADWYTQTDQYREDAKKTCLAKYGVDHHLKAQEVRDKISKTVQERYGVTNVSKSEVIKKRIKDAIFVKYGVEHVMKLPEFVERIKQQNIDKYGVVHPMMLPEYKTKAEATNIRKYGRKAFTQQHITNIQNWYLFMNDSRSYIESHYDSEPSTKELARDLGVDISTVGVYLSKNDSYDCIRRSKSLMEDEILDYLRSLDAEARIIHCDKTAIKPYELDFYLPDIKFAIECDPTCTHNSSAADPWGSAPKPVSYHKMKTDMCETAGIFLLHIFGYDWSHRKDVVKSMIRNVMKKNDIVIYARKCKIIEVSGSACINFLNQNHRQGNANSPIRIGLEYNGELVSLMTFGKMRGTIGTGSENLSDCYELVRFCNKINCSVVGSASKLMHHFIQHHHPSRIRSFSDRAHTSGNLYKVLGFSKVRTSDPGYVWVNTKDDRAYHRMSAQKKNIKNFLKDDSIDLSKSEREIMIEHGFVQVFDSGTILWEWKAE